MERRREPAQRRQEKVKKQHVDRKRKEKSFFIDEESRLDHEAMRDLDKEDNEREQVDYLNQLNAEFENFLNADLKELEEKYASTNQEKWTEEKKARDNYLNAVLRDGEIQVMRNLIERNGLQDKVEIAKDGYAHVQVTNHFSKKKRLPEGYAYKGGAARALLQRALETNSLATPRDLDVVRMTSQLDNDEQDELVARTFMAEDYAHGDGVEVIDDLDTYMSTRDFGMNELIATDEAIIASPKCITDTINRTVTVTPYELEKFDGKIGSKMAVKMMRMQAEAHANKHEIHIGSSNKTRANYFISPFWIAVQLNRALERGDSTTHEFIKQLKTFDQIPDDITEAHELADFLDTHLDYPFVYSEKIKTPHQEDKAFWDNPEIQLLEEEEDQRNRKADERNKRIRSTG